jgi:hypothetical protein
MHGGPLPLSFLVFLWIDLDLLFLYPPFTYSAGSLVYLLNDIFTLFAFWVVGVHDVGRGVEGVELVNQT